MTSEERIQQLCGITTVPPEVIHASADDIEAFLSTNVWKDLDSYIRERVQDLKNRIADHQATPDVETLCFHQGCIKELNYFREFLFQSYKAAVERGTHDSRDDGRSDPAD